MEELSLKNIALVEHFRQLPGSAEILVVARALAGKHGVKHMMEIIAPHCLQAVAATAGRKNIAGIVLVGFRHDANGALQPRAENVGSLGNFGDDVPRRIVTNGLHGVQAQTIQMIFREPVDGIIDDEAPHAIASFAVVIDRLTPRSLVARGEVWPKQTEVIALVAEMVVDHIQNDGKAAAMSLVDEAAERFRPAVAGLHGIEPDAVVAPVAAAGKGVDRHQLDGGHAELLKGIEPFDGSVESSLGREGAEVKLVEDIVKKRQTAPLGVGPLELQRIDNLCRTVNTLRQQTGDRIGYLPAIDQIVIAVAGLRLDHCFPGIPAGVEVAAQFDLLALPVRRQQAQADFLSVGRPDAQGDPRSSMGLHIENSRAVWILQ